MTQTSSEEDRLHRPAHPRIVAPGHPSLTLAIPGRPPRRTWRPIRRSPPWYKPSRHVTSLAKRY